MTFLLTETSAFLACTLAILGNAKWQNRACLDSACWYALNSSDLYHVTYWLSSSFLFLPLAYCLMQVSVFTKRKKTTCKCYRFLILYIEYMNSNKVDVPFKCNEATHSFCNPCIHMDGSCQDGVICTRSLIPPPHSPPHPQSFLPHKAVISWCIRP